MSIPVKIEVFEGPLDLLLHLIDKNKLNIYDIPISLITDQYLAYMVVLEANQMEVMSEFIEMAAILINIKSRTLLPEEPSDEDEDARDPRLALMERLLEYKKFKLISQQLKELQGDAQRIVFKEASIPDEVSAYIPDIDPAQIVGDLDISKLYAVFQSVMRKKGDKIDPIRSTFGEIKPETFTVEEKMAAIRQLSFPDKVLSFRELLEAQSGKVEVIVTFLAILELMKVGAILIRQDGHFDEIKIQFLGSGHHGN